MKKTVLLTTLILFTHIHSVLAIQELQLDVVDQNFSSSNKIIIDAEQIKKSHATNLAQLLSSQANISVASTGFQPNSIYLRGGDSSHVLILIDGVPTYDPSTVQRTVNLGNLNLKNIQKIEIIKGSQSVVYGGQALSGVISIETFPAQIKNGSTVGITTGTTLPETKIYKDEISGDQKMNFAYDKSKSNQYGIDLSNMSSPAESIAISTAVSAKYIQGSSPVLDSQKTYPQKLGSVDTSILYKPNENQKTILHLNYSDDKSHIATMDNVTALAADTNNFASNTEAYGASVVHKQNDFIQFSLAHQSTRRLFLQSAADSGGQAADEDYQGQLLAARLDVQAVKTDIHQIQWGYSFIQEQMKILKTDVLNAEGRDQNEGFYIKSDTYFTPEFLFEIGVRNQMSKLQAVDNTYQVGITWNKKWKYEYSTGFKTPSLFQLYSSYGNLNLRPEKAKNTSFSYESKYSDQLFFSMTVFDAQFENLIVSKGSPKKFENVSSTRTVGAEVLTSYRDVTRATDYSLSFGYQEPKDLSLNNWLVRRPLRTASLKVSQGIYDTVNVSAELNHTGSRRDIGATGYLTIEDYTLLNLIAQYKPTEQITTFARVDNASNQTYQTNYGFYTQGVVAKLGADISF
jgi:iron complex outermembrane receptor protein